MTNEEEIVEKYHKIERIFNTDQPDAIRAIETRKILEESPCVCIREDMEQGDTLYHLNSWDGGMDYVYIRPIMYCPICGRKLPKSE